MPLHKSQIQRGAHLTGGAFPATHIQRAPLPNDLALTYAEVLKEAGPPPSAARLEELAAERCELLERLADIRRRIAEFRAARK